MAAQTEGVTASFLKELLRRAAVLAADGDDASTGVSPTGPMTVTPRGPSGCSTGRAARDPQRDDAGRRVQHLDVAVDVAPHTELVAGEPQTPHLERPDRARCWRPERDDARWDVEVGPDTTRTRTAADAADHACGRQDAGYGEAEPAAWAREELGEAVVERRRRSEQPAPTVPRPAPRPAWTSPTREIAVS